MTACSASTAHISSLKIAKDDSFTTETTSFAPTDTIYAQATASNLPNAITLEWHITADNVTGQSPNTQITALDKSFTLPSDGTSTYTLSAPTAGWPAGTYTIEVDMMDNGQQRDKKTADITVGS